MEEEKKFKSENEKNWKRQEEPAKVKMNVGDHLHFVTYFVLTLKAAEFCFYRPNQLNSWSTVISIIYMMGS